jgi:peptide/nickel transport system substrate-binding protein
MRLRFSGFSAAIVAAAFCGPFAAAPARARDTLVIGVSQFPSSLHPYIDPEVIKGYILDFAQRPMTAFTPDWVNACVLCAELPTLQNGLVKLETRTDGSPGMAVTWTLKPGLLWGDGVPMTSKDLAYTVKVGKDPGSGFANGRIWTDIDHVDIVDDRTAIVHIGQVSTIYDRIGALLPEHIDGPAFAGVKVPGDYLKATPYDRAPTTPGLYNGPYLLTQYQSGAQVVLEPNPRWTGTKPSIKRVVVRAIENTAALQANLLSGDVDLAPGEGGGIGLTIDQVLALKKQQPDRFNYIFRDALSYSHLDFNLDNPILKDVRVRRAFLLAINRPAISQRLADGLFTIATAWVPPHDPMYASDLKVVPYDPAQARALLKEAGWTPGSDGVLRDASGQRMSLDISGIAGIRFNELLEQVIQDQLKQVGIETVIKNEAFRSFFGETLKKRKFGALALYGWSFSVSYPPRQLYGIDMIPHEANAWGGSNYMDWRNERFEADLKVTETDLDRDHERTAWADMQHLYADELPALPLFFRPEAYVVPKWLKNFTPTGTTAYSSLHAEDWQAE